MKNFLLLIIAFLPVFGFGQTDLAIWNNTSNPTVVSNITAPPLILGGGVSADTPAWAGFRINNLHNNANNTINYSKYIEFRITPASGKKISLSQFKLRYNSAGGDGPTKIQVRYSKNASFPSNGTLLATEQTLTQGSDQELALNFPASYETVTTLYVRLYMFGQSNLWYSDFLIRNSVTGHQGPRISGTVSDIALVANNDWATTTVNNFTTINVLENDVPGANPITGVTIASQSANGNAIVNADKTVKFTPGNNFSGVTSFTYTITDGVTTTAPATVTVTVTPPVVEPLVRWNGTAQQTTPTVISPNMTAANVAVNGATLTGSDTYENFTFLNLPPNTISYTNYIEFAITASTGHKITPEAFKFRYRSSNENNQGPKKFQVRFSTDPAFPSNGLVLAAETATVQNVDTDVTLSFPTGTVVLANQTLKIRIYAYDNSSSYSNFKIKHNNGGNLGPEITGIVAEYDADDINANDDLATTNGGQSVNINVLANDTPGSAPISSVVIATNPASGTVAVNPNNTITYNPGTFVGSTSFTYTISNGNASDTAMVSVTVNPVVEGDIVVWHGDPVARVAPFLFEDNITASNITATGISFNPNEAGHFRFNTLPTAATVDYTKYIQVTVSPSTGYKIAPSQFEFTYRSPSASNSGPKKYQVRYSKNSAFPSNGTVLAGETTAVLDVDTIVTLGFPVGMEIVPGETLYIRIYPYSNSADYSDYYIRHNNGALYGPSISGIVSTYSPVVLSANNDTASTAAETPSVVDILQNDIVGTDPITSITIASQPTNSGGTVVVNGLTNVTFTPTLGFSGTTSFSYTLYNGNVFSTAVVTVTVAAPVTVTWNGTSWSGTPAGNKHVVINGNYNTTGGNSFEAYQLTVNTGFVLTVSQNATVEANGAILNNGSILVQTNGGLTGNTTITNNGVVTVNPGAIMTIQEGITNTGTFTIEDDANLVQISDSGVNTGDIVIKRESSIVKKFDYVYWSSPVFSTAISNLSSGSSSLYYKFDPLVNNWVSVSASTSMSVGTGYIARAPSDLFPTTTSLATVDVSLTGKPNNGQVLVALQAGSASKFNLVGNPYPSAIDADAFIFTNSDLITGTLYFWTHTSAISTSIGTGAQYTADDYAKYNLTGAVGTGIGQGTPIVDENGDPVLDGNGQPTYYLNAPSRYIPSFQGFFVEVDPAATAPLPELVFNNAMRYSEESSNFDNGNFYRNPTAFSRPTVEKNRVWVNITNTQGAYAEALVGYVTGATNGLDKLYDGKALPSANVVSLHSMLATQPLSIQGRSLPFHNTDVIPLGYTATIAGTFSIALNQFDGLFQTQAVYLVDLTNNTYTNLKVANYTFQTTAGTFNSRFELRFISAEELGNNTPVLEKDAITVFRSGTQIQVHANGIGLQQVLIYDLLGRLLLDQKGINSQNYTSNPLQVSNQIVIVKVITDSGAELVKKVMMN